MTFLFTPVITQLLLKALNRLLECPDLNLENLEEETREAIAEAREAISLVKGEERHDVSVPAGDEEYD